MNELEKNIINLYGKQGSQFLKNLPNIIDKIIVKYGLSDLKPLKNLSYHYILSGFQGPQPIILKIGLDIANLKHEAIILKALTEFGVVRVLDESKGMLLLEHAIPGVSLKSLFPQRDDEAIAIASECMKRIHQAPFLSSQTFPHVKDWLQIIHQDINIPISYLHQARVLKDRLLSTSKTSVLLHGDLHHDNILKNKDDWLVIDPKGVIGEPAYEIAAFIRNPVSELLALDNASNIINNRITRFSKIFEISEERILNWCFVQAVLAWSWSLEDGGDDTHFKQLTEIFDKMVRIK